MASIGSRLRQSPTPPPHTPTLSLDTSQLPHVAIPNKHIPYCSPGPAPGSQIRTPATPPASPPSKHLSIQTFSILYPADTYPKIVDSPPVYSIDASTLAAAYDHMATQSFPDANQVFPWLHGLHPDNQMQLAFFIARRKALRKTPKCLRGITVVKFGGDLTRAKLKAAIAPEELFLHKSTFLEVDPRDGFSVRNFQIQAAKMAMVSDVVIYGDDNAVKGDGIEDFAKSVASAQIALSEKCDPGGRDGPIFNVFLVSSECQNRDFTCFSSSTEVLMYYRSFQ